MHHRGRTCGQRGTTGVCVCVCVCGQCVPTDYGIRIWHWAFGIGHWAIGIWHLALGIGHLAFGHLGIGQLAFGTWYLELCIWHVVFVLVSPLPNNVCLERCLKVNTLRCADLLRYVHIVCALVLAALRCVVLCCIAISNVHLGYVLWLRRLRCILPGNRHVHGRALSCYFHE